MSNEREACAAWRNDFFDRTSREPTPTEAWFAALKWQAARQSAGAMAYDMAYANGNRGLVYPEQLAHIEKARIVTGYVAMPLYAAPIGDDRVHDEHVERYQAEQYARSLSSGDNGASGYVQYSDELTPRTPGEKAAYMEGIEEGRMRAVRDAQPAESKRVESCEWSQECDDSGVWESACGEAWVLYDGDPDKNGMKYCHACGKPLVIARASAKGE